MRGLHHTFVTISMAACFALLIVAMSSNATYAIVENAKKESLSSNEAFKSKAVAFSGTINYENILQQAIENSYDIKTSKISIDISNQRLAGAKREYIPHLDMRANTEYSKGLSDQVQGIRSVNGTIINESTRYQNSLSLNFQHTLLDYGVKKNKLNIAKYDILQKETLHIQTLRDLKLEILDLYTNILTTYIELTNLKEEIKLQGEILTMRKRLYGSGLCSKIELKQAEADLNSTFIKVENTNLHFAELLAELSFYTNFMFSLELENVNTFTKDNIAYANLNEIDYTKSPEFMAYQREIDKKKAEYVILKRERLPQVGVYSSYSLYGSDKSSYSSAFSDIAQSNLAFGLSTTLPISEQIKQTPKIKELELQIDSLIIEQTSKVSNFFKEVNKTKQLIAIYEVEKKKNDEQRKILETKVGMLEKLDSQRLINKTDLYDQIIQNNRQNAEFKIIEQKAFAQQIKLQYLLEGTDAKRISNI